MKIKRIYTKEAIDKKKSILKIDRDQYQLKTKIDRLRVVEKQEKSKHCLQENNSFQAHLQRWCCENEIPLMKLRRKGQSERERYKQVDVFTKSKKEF